MQRPLLPETAYTEHASRAVSEFHRDVVDEVARTVERDPVVVVGMAQNPVVRRTRKVLTDAGIEFTYLEYGSYLSAWKPRLAVKMWSGWPTFPQVFVRGTLLGGNHELEKALADGSLRDRLDNG